MQSKDEEDYLNEPHLRAVADNLDAAAKWPPLIDLPDALPPVPELDPGLLPVALRTWVQDITERIQCPIDYPSIGAMVSLAAVVGRQMAVRPRRHDDWTVVPNLWGAIVGRPGVLKSPALAETMRPLQRLEIEARDEYAEACRDYDAAAMVQKASAKQVEREIAAAVKSGNTSLANQLARAYVDADDDAPACRRYVTSDTTIEKLGEILATNARGILIHRDELVGWLRSLDREGREGSRAFFLEAWNGTGRYTYDRIGRGTINIEAACVSILGGIQPGPIGGYLREALQGGDGDDGLIQRLQLVVWPDPPATWRDVDRWPDTDARRNAWETYRRLAEIDVVAMGAEHEDGALPYLRLDDAACETFRAWRSELEQRLRSGEDHPAFEAALAKHRSLVPSLALLIHLADAPNGGPVSERAVIAAVAWAQYLEAHARRLYAPALDPALHAARELDRHIRHGDLGSPFAARDVYRRHWSLLDKDGTRDALDYLSDLGRIRGSRMAGIGRPSIEYRVHPDLEVSQ